MRFREYQTVYVRLDEQVSVMQPEHRDELSRHLAPSPAHDHDSHANPGNDAQKDAEDDDDDPKHQDQIARTPERNPADEHCRDDATQADTGKGD